MKNIIKPLVKTTYSTLFYTSSILLDLFRNDSDYISIITSLVNSNGSTSPTKYFIFVDTKNFKTNVFEGSVGNWKLLKSYLCSIGKPSTPTSKGNFSIGVKGLYFGVEKGYKCKYYTQFKNNYLFHSIIYNLNGTIRDGRLGMAISDGCIRLALNNAKWIWDNVPKNTSVTVI